MIYFCVSLNTALHYAVLADSYATVYTLLEHGANPGAESDAGHTPKMYADLEDGAILKMLDQYARTVGNSVWIFIVFR